jgi:hypothetical protein
MWRPRRPELDSKSRIVPGTQARCAAWSTSVMEYNGTVGVKLGRLKAERLSDGVPTGESGTHTPKMCGATLTG